MLMPCQQVLDQESRQTQENNEASHIRGRRYKDAGAQRGIEVELAKSDGYHRSEKTCKTKVCRHGDPENESQPKIVVPRLALFRAIVTWWLIFQQLSFYS